MKFNADLSALLRVVAGK